MQMTYSSRQGFLGRTIILTLATLLAAALLPGVHISSLWGAIATAVVIAILDNVVRPILIVITLPVTVMTLGIFIFFINAIIIMMADGLLGSRFEVDSFATALLFSLLLTALNYLLELPTRKNEEYQERPTDRQIEQNDDDHFDDYEEVN
ncbi:MAG: phage holin family protein [Bacteroidales bacterium]|nr:phage holin family protein [Bacteroidales bacterium]